ncbi:transmembrane sensor [Catalinimonas alkaloidigena]|uniref:FecR family protein n=1 Tax=Catalinimonas alkaloidigena TaxID=1075417 RepID=UPI002406081E|nr:FecR domain-containing protein [Catalinimonas alkaloidigena]MDF9797941.1 transmembrane sensor [Catalinimonas alkaloidigena]
MHQLLVKYLENKCTAHELTQVLTYLQTEGGQRHLGELMDNEINDDDIHAVEDADYEKVYDRIRNNIKQEAFQSKSATILPYKKWLSIAATISGLILLATVGLLFLYPNETVYETAYGETKSITLPDGSSVTLNANSSLLVKNDFSDQREVWLDGEAFFEVEKTKGQSDNAYVKFIVHTDRLDVEVIGTSFNVQDWKEKTQVVLASGKVKLKANGNEVLTMAPGELAEVLADDSSIQKKIVNPEVYSSWTENQLLCNDTPFKDLAKVIQRRFGKEVVFQDSTLQTLEVSGTLPLHDLALLTEILQESLFIKIQANDDTLFVSKAEK